MTKALFEKHFAENHRSVVVLANPKTVLYDRYAKKDIRQQVICADQLAEYIRDAITASKLEPNSDKEMESLAQFFLGIHKEQKTDYTAKFREALETQAQPQIVTAMAAQQPTAAAVTQPLCPRCGTTMVKREAARGPNVGKEFYGCANYPKCRCIINLQ